MQRGLFLSATHQVSPYTLWPFCRHQQVPFQHSQQRKARRAHGSHHKPTVPEHRHGPGLALSTASVSLRPLKWVGWVCDNSASPAPHPGDRDRRLRARWSAGHGDGPGDGDRPGHVDRPGQALLQPPWPWPPMGPPQRHPLCGTHETTSAQGRPKNHQAFGVLF